MLRSRDTSNSQAFQQGSPKPKGHSTVQAVPVTSTQTYLASALCTSLVEKSEIKTRLPSLNVLEKFLSTMPTTERCPWYELKVPSCSLRQKWAARRCDALTAPHRIFTSLIRQFSGRSPWQGFSKLLQIPVIASILWPKLKYRTCLCKYLVAS